MITESIKKLMKEGDLPQACAKLKEVLSKTPEDPVAQMLYGTCCQLMGDSATFGRIYRDLAPEMELRVAHGERSERVSMWLKYAAMFAVIFTLGFQACHSYAADVNGDDTEEVVPKKKPAKKGKTASQATTRMIVDINKFENKSDVHDSVFATLRARVRQCVLGARKFEVIDLEQLASSMSSNLELVAASILNDEDTTAPEAGKMKVASYMVDCTVLYCGKDKSVSVSDGVASVDVVSKVELQVKITNGETGKILTEKSVIGYGIDKVLSTQGSSSSTGQGMRDAIDEAAHMAADALRELAYPAKIISVSDEDVIINMTDEEVKEGDVFDVVDTKDLGNDEDTGAWLGYGGKTIGRVRVESTGAQTSNAEPTRDKKGRMLDLERLDTDEHMYILRRVSKQKLKHERDEKPRPCSRYMGSRFDRF